MDLDGILSSYTFSMGMYLMAFFITIPLTIALLRDNRIQKTENNLFLLVVLCQMAISADGFFDYMFMGNADYVEIVLWLDNIAFIIAMAGLFCFMRYEIFLLQKRTHISNWVIYFVALLCIIPITFMVLNIALPRPLLYGYDANGIMYYTEFYWLPYVFPAVLIVFGAVLTWSCTEVTTISEGLTLLSFFIFPIIGAVTDINHGSSTIYPLSSLMDLMVYTNIHGSLLRQDVSKEKELAQSRAKLMVSQIQPHFMYNSLNTIYYLIEQDPQQAQAALSTFSDYLRQNVNSLKSDAPVKFSEEINHISAYLSLEKLRFGDRLNIALDVETDDFLVPTLTIQPLVENAVKHGITQREDGGTVLVTSKEDEECYVITIVDDGVGFSENKFEYEEGHTHVGIENVRSRLLAMVNGKLYIDSVPGEGTTCTIVIPKANQPRTENQ